MSAQNEGKEGKETGFDELKDAPRQGSAGRTDDLLSGGSAEEQGDKGFQDKSGSSAEKAAGQGVRKQNP